MSAEPLLCAECQHGTPSIEQLGRLWCAHRVHHGWVEDRPRCAGVSYENRDLYEAKRRRLALPPEFETARVGKP